MSSSSFVVDVDDSIFLLLSTSFEVLGAEAPRHRARLAEALLPYRVELHVDDEVLWVTSDGAAIRVREEAVDRVTARIVTDTRAILAVLDARCTLAEAVQGGSVEVTGPLPELGRLREALLLYVRGGVRSASFPGLLARLRARAARRRERGGE